MMSAFTVSLLPCATERRCTASVVFSTPPFHIHKCCSRDGSEPDIPLQVAWVGASHSRICHVSSDIAFEHLDVQELCKLARQAYER